jgi:membrane protease YdiL (CAAX protease family)
MSTHQDEPRANHHTRTAALLTLASALSGALLIPYLLKLRPELPDLLPIWQLVILQALNTALLCGPLALIGLKLGAAHQLRAPYLDALANRRPLPKLPPRLAMTSLAIGAAAGLHILLVDALVFTPIMPEPISPPPPTIEWWRGLLASLYGAIAEEILTRLFLVSALVSALKLLFARSRATPAIYWSAILIAAALFGALHLPAASHIWPLTPVVILRTLSLNMIVAIPCGYLFWRRRSLEHAMLAHLGADLVLHVLLPLLLTPTTLHTS